MQALLQAAQIAASAKEPARLATIVNVEGSAFRSPGARLLILPDRTVGAISGGCLETEVSERARATPNSALPAVWRYDTRQEDEELLGWGSGCGGAITLLVEDLASAGPTLDFIADRHAAGEPGMVALIYESSDPAIARVGDRMHLGPMIHHGGNGGTRRKFDSVVSSSVSLRSLRGEMEFLPGLQRRIDADVRRVLASRRWMVATSTVRSAEVKVLLEPIVPPIRLLICGIGEEAFALSRLARQLGWHVTLADPRLDPAAPPALARADRMLDVRPGEMLAAAGMPGEFAAVIMTHRLLQDAELLAELLPSRVRYIGVLGPRRRLQLLLEKISDVSIPPSQLAKLHGPAGLDIGGESPEEIALSVAAEIAAVFAGRQGGMLCKRRGGIHAGPAKVAAASSR